jgi:tetratricopeptide (TPR) repeat protein
MTSSAQTVNSAPGGDRLGALVNWVRGHRQAAVYIGGALVLAVALGVWGLWSGKQTEQAASEQLAEARFAFESDNMPLAASEFARITENYAGTRAAEEATILLAHVRLLQGQSQQALDVLRGFAPRASREYEAQAYGLMGAAYENLGRPKEAAQAFQEAAEHALWPFLAGQYLSDAGRAWMAAQQPDSALRVYRHIVSEYEESGPVAEAKVRIGELLAGN